MSHFKKIEDQLISTYESTLAVEGREVCEEVDSILPDDIDLIREKAHAYCLLCTFFKKDVIYSMLLDRCKKYLDDTKNYNQIKSTLEHISRTRKMV